jgi:hypothetical protein
VLVSQIRQQMMMDVFYVDSEVWTGGQAVEPARESLLRAADGLSS